MEEKQKKLLEEKKIKQEALLRAEQEKVDRRQKNANPHSGKPECPRALFWPIVSGF